KRTIGFRRPPVTRWNTKLSSARIIVGADAPSLPRPKWCMSRAPRKDIRRAQGYQPVAQGYREKGRRTGGRQLGGRRGLAATLPSPGCRNPLLVAQHTAAGGGGKDLKATASPPRAVPATVRKHLFRERWGDRKMRSNKTSLSCRSSSRLLHRWR